MNPTMNDKMKRLLVTTILVGLASSAKGGEKYDPTTLVFPSFLHTMGIRKATSLHLRIYTKNRVKARDPQGIAVVRLSSWDDPNKTKDDDEVTGYGVNSGENVIVYNTSMTSLGIYGLNETGVKALKNPKGIAANEKGDVYLADTGNHRIVRFKNPSKRLLFVRAIGGRGALVGQFESPEGVALDSQSMVYVSDTGNHRIQIIRPDDTLHHWFGKQGVEQGQLWHPTGIAVSDRGERWSYYRDDFIVVIDLDQSRIQKFTHTGKFLKAVSLKDLDMPAGHLGYLAIDYYSNIWVTDTAQHQIHKFDHNLNYLTSFGRKGKGDKEFNEPRGIAIFRRFGQVFVAEKESAQYYWIGTDVFDFHGKWNQEFGVIELSFFLTEPSFVNLWLEPENAGERLVLEKVKLLAGSHKIYLDDSYKQVSMRQMRRFKTNGSLSKLIPVSHANYEVKLKIEPTYSSYQYFSKEVTTRVEVR